MTPATASLVRRTIARYVTDRALVDDLVQETLLRVHLAASSFRGATTGPAFARWCISVARNTAIDGLRRELRHRRTALDPELIGGDDDPESVAMACEHELGLCRRVHAAIARLPPAARQVVVWHKLDGMRMQEIAHRLGARLGTVRVRAHRGYARLAEALGEDAPRRIPEPPAGTRGRGTEPVCYRRPGWLVRDVPAAERIAATRHRRRSSTPSS